MAEITSQSSVNHVSSILLKLNTSMWKNFKLNPELTRECRHGKEAIYISWEEKKWKTKKQNKTNELSNLLSGVVECLHRVHPTWKHNRRPPAVVHYVAFSETHNNQRKLLELCVNWPFTADNSVWRFQIRNTYTLKIDRKPILLDSSLLSIRSWWTFDGNLTSIYAANHSLKLSIFIGLQLYSCLTCSISKNDVSTPKFINCSRDVFEILCKQLLCHHFSW